MNTSRSRVVHAARLRFGTCIRPDGGSNHGLEFVGIFSKVVPETREIGPFRGAELSRHDSGQVGDTCQMVFERMKSGFVFRDMCDIFRHRCLSLPGVLPPGPILYFLSDTRHPLRQSEANIVFSSISLSLS